MGNDLASARGTPEWAIAIVCAHLANGGGCASSSSATDLTAAAEALLIAFREIGHDYVVTDDGVWALPWLEDDEVFAFARSAVGSWLRRSNLEVRKIGRGAN